MKAVPVVDLDLFVKGSETDRQAFVQALGDTFRTYGFAVVKNHGLPMDLVQKFYDQSNTFFGLDTETKRKYEIAGMAGQRGYTSFGKEHAKQSNVGDLKEFFQVGQETEDITLKDEYPDNVHVAEVPEFKATSMNLYRSFENSGRYLLRAIALYLNLDEHYFDDKIANGNSILRSIHYPPITEEPKSAIRSEEHEDINLITLLVGASAGGLQLLDADNEWLAVTPKEDEIAINVGDMLQRLTNNYLKSTTHRVVNPPREKWHEPRLSIPFFLHPTSDMDLTCLPNCISDESPKQYEDYTAGQYLDERLREIGLKK